jgi:hypothetical protein
VPLTIGRLVKPPTKEQPGKTSCNHYASLAVDLLSPRAFEPLICQFSHRYRKKNKKKLKLSHCQTARQAIMLLSYQTVRQVIVLWSHQGIMP